MANFASFNTVASSGSDKHWRVASAGDVPTLLLSGTVDDRSYASLFNQSNGALYLKFGDANNLKISGSMVFDYKVLSGTLFELPRPVWQGQVWGCWEGSGWVMVLQLGKLDS